MLLVITVVRVHTVYSKNAQQIETEEIEINTRLFSHSFIIGCISTGGEGLWPGPQRENFPGGTKVDTGLPNLIGPPKPLNHFLSDGCRSSFKSEGMTIFAYS